MTIAANADRHVLLTTVGSAGDVHPYVGLGIALRRRGYRVTLVTAGYFRSLAEKSGLEFVDAMPEVDFVGSVNNPRIWHPLSGPRAIMEIAVRPLLEPIYRAIAERYEPGRTVVIASTLAFGARVAQEKLGVPTVTVHLSPSIFRSDFEGPKMPNLSVHRGPAWFRHLQWFLADRLVVDPMVCPWLNPFRASLGLKPVTGVFRDWWHSPLRVWGMFPDWFAALQPDWPTQTRLLGFPLYDEGNVVEPSEELRAFVEGGDPPLVFTPGSANVYGRGFFQAAIDACCALGRRGVLLTRFVDQIPQPLPDSVRHFDYVPFTWLLPRSAAVAHHGGIGSLSQGLAHGVPQIIMPLAFDQFDNAARIERLGVGRALPPKQFRGLALANLLRELLDSSDVKRRCADIASRFAGVNALEGAVDEIDQIW